MFFCFVFCKIYTKNFCSCFLIEADCVCVYIMFVCNLTQYSQHSVVLKHFHGARADKVYGLQSVTLANKELPRSTKRGFDDERQRAQTPSTGRFKQRQLQQLFIQVHGNVSPQFIWEVLQKLGNDKDILSTLRIHLSFLNIFIHFFMFDYQKNNCSKETVDQSSSWTLMGYYIGYQSRESGL